MPAPTASTPRIHGERFLLLGDETDGSSDVADTSSKHRKDTKNSIAGEERRCSRLVEFGVVAGDTCLLEI